MTGYQYDQEATLVTTDKGCINLGQLEFVEKMRVQINVKNRIFDKLYNFFYFKCKLKKKSNGKFFK